MKITIYSCLLLILLMCPSEAQQARSIPTVIDKTDVQTLRQPDALHKLASRHGGLFTQEVSIVPFVRRESLSELVKDSDLVVEIHIVGNRCELINDGKSIVTNYHGLVDQVFDNTTKVGDNLQVVMPGGRITFTDGTIAQVDFPHQEPMANNRHYILFLRKIGDGQFAPVGMDEGIFELTANNQVRPLVWDRRSPLSGESKLLVREFIERVRRAVQH